MREHTNNKKTHILFISLLFIIIAAITVSAVLINKTVKKSLYLERKELLHFLTGSSADLIATELSQNRTIIDMISDDAERYLTLFPSLEDYFDLRKDSVGFKENIYFFVDTSGKYYSSDGVSGKMIDLTYYTDSSAAEELYISNLPHLGSENSYFVFRNRLKTPLTVEVASGEAEICYCGFLFDINALNRSISAGFAGENNTFIYDDSSGVMLYKQFGIRLLIDGFNIYPKFSASELLYEEQADVAEQTCRGRETYICGLVIDGEYFYFCSSPITDSPWSLSFIVKSESLDTLSGSGFSNIILYISAIAILFTLTVATAFAFFYRSKVSRSSLKRITALNEDLEAATKAKSDFLSNMSHDIRTPINGIVGMTAIAKNVPGNPEKTVECLNKIEGASGHLLSLVNDVLDMTRIERGRIDIAALPMNIAAEAENCCSIIRGQMSGRDLELISTVECPHTNLLGDELHLRQVLINILGNAVKFTPDGGTIRFTVKELSCEGDTAVITFIIADTGIGMQPEFLPKVFDTFTQDEGGARSSYRGTGLGMPIAKQLTELMGGTITVESELNKGSTFTVTVPFTVNTAAAEEKQPEKEIAADITGVKILLAEDNELNMDIAVELLGEEGEGAVITPVTDGLQALEAFKNSAPGTFDVILMDVMMPKMNGIEATKAIRLLEREDAKTIPILAMTANAFESDIRATQAAGMNAHLTKPINIATVVKTIAKFTRH